MLTASSCYCAYNILISCFVRFLVQSYRFLMWKAWMTPLTSSTTGKYAHIYMVSYIHF